MPEFRIVGEQLSFWLRVKPRSTREQLTLDAAGELRLDLHAPPAEGQANEACTEFFARTLRLRQSSIVIVSGHKSRRKLLRVTSRSAEETRQQILRAVTSDK